MLTRNCRPVNVTKNQNGFSLVEVVVALIVLAVLSVGLLRGAISAHRSVPAQLDRSGAQNLGRAIIESLYEAVRQDWWNLTDRPLSVGTPLGAPRATTVAGRTYTSEYSVAAVNLVGDPGQDYRKIEVTVR